ncbi:acyl carrier protein [Streptococcus chenjunshii]|uniref:Acyl carrier protein n=1 Tax=Streptococcus chenjunshii TaxID=2173853 RepID=A0A372KKH5_9STRE|nr:acyl carrier protein [Streptococcus chenjunshii]AXQ79674.1 acyl carrier protein [Streptococcus chenjunshii]RFU50630.1 acyl carrier protein [Streptococcus chenjunshii]RFU52767.1 acyl carrier protein [Streptococcus chenjunshii]
MTKEEIFDKISKMLAEQMHRGDLDISPETSLQDDLGVDSIGLMEFVINLEDEFHLDIPDEAIEEIESMGEMADYLYQKLA